MSEKNDGGWAFPFTVNDDRLDEVNRGMTLRDYFAGQALAGLCANLGATMLSAEDRITAAYGYADLMLKEREK